MNPPIAAGTASVEQRLGGRIVSALDRRLPRGSRRPVVEGLPRRTAAGIFLTWLGIGFVATLAILYGYLGSHISAIAIGVIALSLVFVVFFVPQDVPLATVGNGVNAVSWLVTFLVVYRTAGVSSPAIVWCFLHPITAYLCSGRRSAAVWSVLSTAQIALIFAAERLGLTYRRDLTPYTANLLRTLGFLSCILGTVILIAGAESARQASQGAMDQANKALERQRILGDMHDGVGSQLLGLMIQVRAKKIDEERLLQGLNSCLDDLKLIVDSLDPVERSFEVAIAELRDRMEPRCAAAGIDLAWTLEPDLPAISPEQTLQVLRALQELTTNALRHAKTDRIEVSLGRRKYDKHTYEVLVKDYGIGFDPDAPTRTGRGMTLGIAFPVGRDC